MEREPQKPLTRTKPLSVDEAKARLLECGDQFDWKSAATPIVQSALTTLLTTLIKRAAHKWTVKSCEKPAPSAPPPSQSRAEAVAEVKVAAAHAAASVEPKPSEQSRPAQTVFSVASAAVKGQAAEFCMDACEAMLQSVKRNRAARASQNGVHTH